jgi:alanyl-tRNA synthetase
MTAHEIRQSFLDYFDRHGHRIVASAPLVPGDDPTLLFTNAGMNQFKDLFLGKERREYRRATTSQKVMRVSGKHNDLDNVGPSHRHHTFFEMLGNFSFGDYFKQEAIPLAWRLLTDVWKLDPERMYPTIFKGEPGIPRDDESFDIWTRFVPAERITELGSADNFWQMGDTGPCGRCSEIMFYRPDAPCTEPVCRGMTCTCDRYFEIWNNVFMEFNRTEDGVLQPLPALSVDTGMGLERVTSVLQNKFSNYDTDIFMPLLDAIGAAAGLTYTHFHGGGDHPDVSMRVIADHLRAMTFLIADGVLPSNEWRGYVLRKIMRRAMRHGKKLGVSDPFLHNLVDVVVREMGQAYPELKTNRDAIVRTVRAEEDRFDLVLTSGLPRLEDLIDRTIASGASQVPGEEVFRLYDSLGVPYDFAEDLASQRSLTIDRAGFEQAMGGQRERARAGSSFEAKKAAGFEYPDDTTRARIEALPDVFDGYAFTEVLDVEVVALFDDQRRLVRSLPAAASGYVVLDRSPFYVESGGQVSDTGILRAAGAVAAAVTGMARVAPGAVRVHRITTSQPLTVTARVDAMVDADVRDATRRNHTATHLLHAALRARLGSHVRQKGSLVSPDRLRFDFDHFQPMTPEERLDVERAVNAQVYRNTAVVTEEQSTEEAIKAGAMALFGEKYGENVRVVSIAGYSTELCGGIHVKATGDIGPFVLTEESGVAAGVRRIEALTGAVAVAHLQGRAQTLDRASAALGVPVPDTVTTIEKLQAEARRLARENAQLKMKLALGGPGRTDDDSVQVADAKFVARRVSDLDKDALRGLSDSLRDRIGRGVVVLVAEHEDKVQLVVSVSKDLTSRIKAGQLVKDLAPMVGGKGGGRPDFAEAGGRDASKIDDLLAAARDLVAKALASP